MRLYSLTHFVMTHQTSTQSITNYRSLYDYLVVLTDEQISKLRNIAIGTKNLSSFSEGEIRELEMKLNEKEVQKK